MFVLNTLARKSSDLLELNPKCSSVFIQVRNVYFTDTSHLILFDILFVLKVNLVLFCQFTVVHFDLISSIFFCRYASRTLKMQLLTWCKVISRGRLVGSGSGLSLSKYFEPISGLHANFFMTLRVGLTIFFFRDVDL